MSCFNGMVEVNSGYASKSALNAICFIERARNKKYRENLEKAKKMSPFMLWADKDAISTVEYFNHLWNHTPISEDVYRRVARNAYWEVYGSQLRMASDILHLTDVARDGKIYVAPAQAELIKLCEGEVEEF